MFEVFLNGKVVSSKENTTPAKYKNIKVFAGDKWFSAVNGLIKNLLVFSGRIDRPKFGKTYQQAGT